MCYKCNRPQIACLCSHITPIKTKTLFVILMHPKEYKYIKNNTGRLTHLSLENSKLFVAVDFSNHSHVNDIINDKNNHCVILYPSNDSLCINEEKLQLEGKNLVIFIIDATWDSAKPILRLSKNLHDLSRISFTHTKTSAYSFKRQPFKEALSTMESTGCVLDILKKQNLETISSDELDNFLNPFNEMIKYQMEYVNSQPRFRSGND